MRCLLFDLDGVLVDTRPLVVATVHDTAQILNLAPRDAAAVEAVLGLAPSQVARQLFPGNPAARTTITQRFAHHLDSASPCSGIRELLTRAGAQLPLGVVTSRNRQEAERCLRGAGLKQFFRAVITWGDTTRHKPAPDPLLEGLRQLGGSGGVYIGDTPGDMRAAQAAGLLPIGAGWASSYGDADLRRAGAALVAQHPLEVLPHLH